MAERSFSAEPVEEAVFRLRELYESFGYEKYRMSKFEEYGLYMENKSFLPSSQVIAFTDLDGRLMALKPDVTLSIANNIPQELAEDVKVYYNENVYRSPAGSGQFREIAQVGLEYLGEVDLYDLCEVVSLAWKSLKLLSAGRVMALSHMGYVSGLLEACGFGEGLTGQALRLVEQKNAHEIERLCGEHGITGEKREALVSLPGLYGEFDDTLRRAEKLVCCDKMSEAVGQLSELRHVLFEETGEEGFGLDFSVINDLSYYDSIIFQGFIEGVPRAILSGGRYDRLMERLGKRAGAIGFAVYVNELERLQKDERGLDADIMLITADETAAGVMGAAEALRGLGHRVRVVKKDTDRIKCARKLTFKDGRLVEYNGNA